MPEMARVETGVPYKVGRGGLRVIWRDGSVSTYAEFSRVVFGRYPLKVEGRLLRTGGTPELQFEVPAFVPFEVKV